MKKLPPDTLRRHKGVSFTGIATTFWCHNGRGRLLLSRRSMGARDECGTWEPGTGGLRHGQSLVDNVRRELKEEYNTDPLTIDFIGYRDVFRNLNNGTLTHWLAMDFAVIVDPSKVRINEPEKIDALGWFALDKLPSPLHSQFAYFLMLHGDKLRAHMKV